MGGDGVGTQNLAGIERAVAHNQAYVAPNDILAAALAPSKPPSLFRVFAAFNLAGVLRATITRGGNTQVVDFNEGANLAANSLYWFDVVAHEGDTVNFRYSVNATIMVLRVMEIVVGVQ